MTHYVLICHSVSINVCLYFFSVTPFIRIHLLFSFVSFFNVYHDDDSPLVKVSQRLRIEVGGVRAEDDNLSGATMHHTVLFRWTIMNTDFLSSLKC